MYAQIYASFFSLNESSTMRAHEYMRYYQIIRRCCGMQVGRSDRIGSRDADAAPSPQTVDRMTLLSLRRRSTGV